jgi:hypothetical protein
MSTRRLRLVIRRDSHEETTLAIVTANVREDIASAQGLRLAISRAVTRWIRTTHEGRATWVGCSEDLNIGDLGANYNPADAGRGTLNRLLDSEGVYDLDIDLVSEAEIESSWSYDTVLAFSAELENEDAASENAPTS